MSMNKPKLLAAISVAVTSFLSIREEVKVEELANKSKLMAAISVAVISFLSAKKETKVKSLVNNRLETTNLWRISARQETMQLRQLCQLRLLKR